MTIRFGNWFSYWKFVLLFCLKILENEIYRNMSNQIKIIYIIIVSNNQMIITIKLRYLWCIIIYILIIGMSHGEYEMQDPKTEADM